MTVTYLTLEDALRLVCRLDADTVRDLGLLDSALHRPGSCFLNTEVYPELEFKAAALLQSIAKNHPLVDGNKRLAWLATVVFLDLNGHRCALDRPTAVQLVLDVAKGDLDVAEVAARLVIEPAGTCGSGGHVHLCTRPTVAACGSASTPVRPRAATSERADPPRQAGRSS